jgi:hypothetical protein
MCGTNGRISAAASISALQADVLKVNISHSHIERE